ncbi:MAG: hypothetical protein LC136_01425 [Burkholderiales bacterium]|nr:hypothetical protein [Burkholderiales bacterium]
MGRRPDCKVCVCARTNAYRLANVERIAENKRRYREENRGRLIEKARRYYAENAHKFKEYREVNRDRRIAQKREWDAVNVERRREYERLRWQLNPKAMRAKDRNRKEAIHRARPSWADAVAIAAFYEQAVRLSRCTGIPHHVDHVVPLRGRKVSGLHVPLNLRVIPAALNIRKGNRYAPETRP